jgi:transposase
LNSGAVLVDVILGQPRRTWSRDEKLAIVAETFVVGARVVDVMRRHRISSGQIHTWRKQFRAELGFPAPEKPAKARGLAPLQFMPLAIATEAAATTIEIDLSGAKMKITGAIDAALMAALVKALAGKSR